MEATLDGEPIAGFHSNKVRALLAYLAVEANRPHRREVLVGLLGPDYPERLATCFELFRLWEATTT